MARKTHVELTDDIDGSEGAETVAFALRGTAYEIDLSAKNAAKLEKALAPYVSVARRAGRTGRAAATGQSNAKEMRAWAVENGYEVPSRGRVPAHIREAYEAS